jgi:hypothetical protein
MRIVSGKVIDGKVVVEGEKLDEGAVVTVVAREDDETFELSAEDEAALLASIAAAVFAADENAFKTEFPKGTNGTGALADAVELGFNQLATAIGGMPTGKL